MRKRAVIAAVVALLIVTGAAMAFAMGDANVVSGSWRYKMTVRVETPEGVKSGSAVREISNSFSDSWPDCPECSNPPDLKGEAVVVDLGERGVLFALLSGGVWLGPDQGESIVFYAFPYSGGYGTSDGIRHYGNLKEGKVMLGPALYPMLVTFTDMNDPKSIKSVLETGYADKKGERRQEDVVVLKDNFEELFGKGVKLKDITVEMTTEPVTWGMIDKYLPENYHDIIVEGWRKLSFEDRKMLSGLTSFKRSK